MGLVISRTARNMEHTIKRLRRNDLETLNNINQLPVWDKLPRDDYNYLLRHIGKPSTYEPSKFGEIIWSKEILEQNNMYFSGSYSSDLNLIEIRLKNKIDNHIFISFELEIFDSQILSNLKQIYPNFSYDFGDNIITINNKDLYMIFYIYYMFLSYLYHSTSNDIIPFSDINNIKTNDINQLKQSSFYNKKYNEFFQIRILEAKAIQIFQTITDNIQILLEKYNGNPILTPPIYNTNTQNTQNIMGGNNDIDYSIFLDNQIINIANEDI